MDIIRLTAKAETIGDETRYKLIDHFGQKYVNHGQEYPSYGYHDDTDEKYLARWKESTSETAEQAFIDHAPPDGRYTVLPPDTHLVKITIYTLTDNPSFPFYTLGDDLPPFNTRPQAGEYYAFTTLEGVQELFLYSDIKHISFKEI